MSAHGATRQLAYQAACTLAAAGQRPTIAAVRARLGGTGSQQAIKGGIDDWLDEAARRFQIPGIPAALRAEVVQTWDLACRLAGAQWGNAKAALEAQVAALNGQLATLSAQHTAAQTEIQRLGAERAVQAITLRETQDALEAVRNTLAARSAALHEMADALAQARAQGEEAARQREQAERVTATTREGLHAAQERNARLQVEQEVATARAQLLERAQALARDTAAQARADLEAAQARAEDGRRTVSERDGQLAMLTATIQAEQQSRDADTQHWLSRLDEHQAALAQARTRETALIEEKKALVLEAQRLRQEVRRMQAQSRATPSTVDNPPS